MSQRAMRLVATVLRSAFIVLMWLSVMALIGPRNLGVLERLLLFAIPIGSLLFLARRLGRTAADGAAPDR